ISLADFLKNLFAWDLTVMKDYMNMVIPLFVGGILLYTVSLIEKSYQEEKARRQKYESDLDLAREIQDSLSPPPDTTVMGNIKVSCYQIKHHQVAGDWTACRRIGDDRTIIVVADATGKGMQAALVIHAVQSLWAEQLDYLEFKPQQWIERVNRALFKLGE